jgi:hypothetical protein
MVVSLIEVQRWWELRWVIVNAAQNDDIGTSPRQ